MPHSDAIGELVERYAAVVDARTFERLDEVFTPEAILETGRGRRAGLAEIRAAMTGLSRYESTRHVVGQIALDPVDPADAAEALEGTVECVAHHWFTEAGRRIDRQMAITYHDRYVHTDAGWRIEHRRLEIHSSDEIPEP